MNQKPFGTIDDSLFPSPAGNDHICFPAIPYCEMDDTSQRIIRVALASIDLSTTILNFFPGLEREDSVIRGEKIVVESQPRMASGRNRLPADQGVRDLQRIQDPRDGLKDHRGRPCIPTACVQRAGSVEAV